MPASTLEQVFQHFKSEPIHLDEFDDYYIQADKGRGRPVCKRLRRCLERDPQGSMKFLFAGHKGCGKSTELTRLQKYIEKDFVTLNFSIVKKEVLRKKIEPKLSGLISNCNLLIREIKNNLDKINKKGLVIIIEDLDKVNIEKGMDIFYLHSTQLTQLSCHCIYTFPIALRYNAQFNPIKVNYDECFVLPMIKINQKDGRPFDDGREILKNIVENRMNLNLFEKRKILTQMIEKSGGCIWDLFRLIKESAEIALDFEKVAIGEDDYQSAYYGIKADYEAQITENVEKGYKVEDWHWFS